MSIQVLNGTLEHYEANGDITDAFWETKFKVNEK
jgi:hypothetical protein